MVIACFGSIAYASSTIGPRWCGPARALAAAARLLCGAAVPVRFASVLMRQNAGDYLAVTSLAEEMGAGFSVDPTITPMMDGDRSILAFEHRALESRAGLPRHRRR